VYDMRAVGDNGRKAEAQLIAGIRAGDRTAFRTKQRERRHYVDQPCAPLIQSNLPPPQGVPSRR
jgi:hypothetical protein